MPSILSVAKSKLLGRNKSRSKRSKAGDNGDIVNDTEKEKVVPQVPVAPRVEVPREDPGLPRLSVPQLESRTQSEIVSSIPTDGFQTPHEQQFEVPKELDDNDTIVHELEETKLVDATAAPTQQDEVGNENETNEEGVGDVKDTGSNSPAAATVSVEEGEIDSEETQGNSVDSAVPQTVLDPQSVVQKYERELDAISDRNRSLEEELWTALDTVASKTEEIDHLLAEIGGLKRDVEAIFQEKEEAQMALEEEEKLMEEKLETERENLRRVTKESEEARVEIQRVRSTAAVDKRIHEERGKELLLEKEQLAAGVESSRAEIEDLKLQIQSQTDRIEGLETRLQNSREENRGLYERYQGPVSKIKQLEDALLEERAVATSKDTRIEFLETTNNTLSTSLVEVQYKMRRQNDMLVDQLRQQSDRLQLQGPIRAQVYADSLGAEVGRFMSSNANVSTISNFTRGIRRGAATAARADTGVKTLLTLNEEIYQVAATLTDKLEGIDKRFVNGDSLPSASGRHPISGVRPAKTEYLKSILGLELMQRLENNAQRPMEDTNPFYLQTALQGCLTACCMRIITSWYPSEWEYGKLLETLYEKIRGRNGLDIALAWRKITQENFFPSAPRDKHSKLVDYLKNDLRSILLISGWSSDSNCDTIVESLRQKLLNIVAAAIRLNTMTAVGLQGELEAVFVERGSAFDPRAMEDDYPPERTRYTEASSKDEKVSCVVGIGLKWADNTEVNSPLLLLKPKVVLSSALHSISDSESFPGSA